MKLRIARRVLLGILVTAAVSCGDDSESGADPGALAAAGAEAFYDTLFGLQDRSEEAIELLEAAWRANPADGLAVFRLGMMHLFRFSQHIADFWNPTEFDRREVRRAHEALNRAVVLLPEDLRVPGFRAAATYLKGVIDRDEELRQTGLEQLRDAIELYPEFNIFDFIGVVAPTVSAHDPLYNEVMQFVGDPLNAACSPFTQPEICGNAGKAPHNIEGSLLLFGDLFAKAGDASRAVGFYRLALTPFSTEPWRFRSVVEERLRTVNERITLYRDADPTNDPPLAGYRAEACAICHYR